MPLALFEQQSIPFLEATKHRGLGQRPGRRPVGAGDPPDRAARWWPGAPPGWRLPCKPDRSPSARSRRPENRFGISVQASGRSASEPTVLIRSGLEIDRLRRIRKHDAGIEEPPHDLPLSSAASALRRRGARESAASAFVLDLDRVALLRRLAVSMPGVVQSEISTDRMPFTSPSPLLRQVNRMPELILRHRGQRPG